MGEGVNLIEYALWQPLVPRKDAQTAPSEQVWRSSDPGREDIIDQPIAINLPEGRIAEQSGGQKHLVGGLEHSLQV